MKLNDLKETYQLALAEYQKAAENFYKKGEGSREMIESNRQSMLEAKRVYEQAVREDNEKKAEEKRQTALKIEKEKAIEAQKKAEAKAKVKELLLSEDPALDTWFSCNYHYITHDGWTPREYHHDGIAEITLREKIIRELLEIRLFRDGEDIEPSSFRTPSLRENIEIGIDDELGLIDIDGNMYETTARIAKTMTDFEFKTNKQLEQERQKERQRELEARRKREEERRLYAERKFKKEHPIQYRLAQIKAALDSRRERGE